MSTKKPNLFTPWRRLLQWGASLAILILPFIKVNGESSIRIDIPSFSVFFFGMHFRIEELYLLWLAVLSFIFLFLLVTLVLGRVWCGWACPQTTLSDFVEGVAEMFGMQAANNRISGSGAQMVALHFVYICLALLVGANLVWYFVSPYEFFPLLFSGGLGPWPLGSMTVVAVVVYINLAFLRRLFCKEFCPYGRFQTVLVDKGTLTLWYHPDEAERCIECHACERSCPMGIDIRNGFQVECINCAKCLDACRRVMARRREPGIIRYTFGQSGRGWRALLTIRTGLVLTVFLAAFSALVIASLNRPEANLKVSRLKTTRSRITADHMLATFYTGYVALHRENQGETFSIHAFDKEGKEFAIKGPVKNFTIARDQNLFRFNFALLTHVPEDKKPLAVTFILQGSDGRVLDRTESLVPGVMKP
ncbi:MAG: 4Fe-4S dicluster domain-containing protein [Desulfobulbales bacterium]|nr:4Fe-4S dicluster domain-containing protein [Desulfobulbales bacterium]